MTKAIFIYKCFGCPHAGLRMCGHDSFKERRKIDVSLYTDGIHPDCPLPEVEEK
jgi:hypothetical protein